MVHYKVSPPNIILSHPAKVTTQAEVVEITMRLESTPGGAEISVGLAQVQSQLAKLTIQLQDMAKYKVVQENLWCTTCRSEGHR
jgi:hypothetical protein